VIVVRALFTQNPIGDIDNDGDVDLRDLKAVIRALIRGC
jgi:hypothetical protein